MSEKNKNTNSITADGSAPEIDNAAANKIAENSNKIDNSKLQKALDVLKEDDTPANRNIMFEELIMHSRLMVPGSFDPPPVVSETGKVVVPEGAKINFQMVTSSDKRNWFMAFTNMEEMKKWPDCDAKSTLALGFDDLAGLVQRNVGSAGMVVNPFSNNLVIPREMIDKFVEQKKLRMSMSKNGTPIAPNKQVAITDPRVFPERMTEALKKFFKNKKQVHSAYVRMMIQGKLVSYLIVVDFDGEKQPLFDQIAEIAKPFLGTFYLNIVPLNAELGTKATEKSEPFYTKKESKPFFFKK